MSVVILGGNECMVRKYKDLCRSYQCSAKVISKMGGTLKNRLGNPDLLVMFTDTISHKMVQNALNETRGQDTVIIRSRSSSMLSSSLSSICRAVTAPHCSKILSARVLLPWSICAIIEKFLILSFTFTS